MTIDRRGERAGADFRRAVDEWGSSELDPRSFARFERFRGRRLRNRRIAAGVVAATVTVVSVVLVTRAFGPVDGEAGSTGSPARPDPVRRAGPCRTARAMAHGSTGRFRAASPRPDGHMRGVVAGR
jgi:hypothetical protein